jgi:hypothetical protein
MTVKWLIEKLSQFPPDTEVFVWEGYDAGFKTDEFDVQLDEHGDLVLEP